MCAALFASLPVRGSVEQQKVWPSGLFLPKLLDKKNIDNVLKTGKLLVGARAGQSNHTKCTKCAFTGTDMGVLARANFFAWHQLLCHRNICNVCCEQPATRFFFQVRFTSFTHKIVRTNSLFMHYSRLKAQTSLTFIYQESTN